MHTFSHARYRRPHRLELDSFEGQTFELVLANQVALDFKKELVMKTTLTRIGPQVKFAVRMNGEQVFDHVYVTEAIEHYNTL